jgi:peroxiredoxin
MKKLFLIFCLSPFLAFAQKNENNAPMQQRVQLNNFIDSFSYAIGLNVSNSLMQQGVMTLNIGAMSQAFIDMMTNKDKQFSGEMANAIIQAQFQQIAQSKAAVVEENNFVGKTIPDFEQADVNGKMVNIKSFRGKYVLVDFWASWCGPCRGENPNVVAAYNKYKSKNFTVLSISLDKTKDSWVEAIKKDGLNWTNVSDLKFWSNAVAQQFGITSIPQNFLVDPNGVIIDKNLRGEALEQKLASILK